MQKDKITIYLTELAHNGFGLSLTTCPLGIGVIGAYCKKIHQDSVEIRLFRQIEDLISACKEKQPHIIGFGYFSWNDTITVVASKIVRDLCPESVLVLGGSSIDFYIHELTTRVFPKDYDQKLGTAPSQGAPLQGGDILNSDIYIIRDDLQLLHDLPHVDLLVHGDGEVPFAAIVSEFLQLRNRHELKQKGIEGCSSLVEGTVVQGKAAPLLYELDAVPSPYVAGLFTEFFDRFQLIPQIETLRGCPFQCTFCAIGLMSGKLRRHTLEYTKEEILYLKDHSPNKVLRIADPNWGLVKHDVALAEYIKELRDQEGYPGSLRVYYSASGPLKNVQQMATSLKTLLPLNMSFQSLTKDVLKNIKRTNMALSNVEEMVKFAHGNRIATSTELISSLPGETYESFRQCFLKAVELRIDSIYMGYLYLIKGSELYTHASREKYGFKTAYSLIGKDATKVGNKWTFEMDEVVVETNTIGIDDFWELHRFRLFGQIAYAAAYWKEIIMHCLNYHITPLHIYDELFSHPEKYPFINQIASQYIESIKKLYFKSPQALEKALIAHVEKYKSVDAFTVSNLYTQSICKVQGLKEKRILIGEVVEAARVLYQTNINNGSEKDFLSILSLLAPVQAELIITPLGDFQEAVVYESSYDLIAWAGDSYRKPLSEYRSDKPITFNFCVRNMGEHLDFIEKTQGMSEIQKHEFFFKTMVSANMRRYMVYADEFQLPQRHLLQDAIAPMTN